jgi:PAS domain S-box-containing protein
MPSYTSEQYEAMLATIGEKAQLAMLRAEINAAFNRPGDLDVVLQACTEALVKNLNAAFARIWVLDKTGQVLELKASAGIYTHLDGPHGKVRVGDFKIGRIAQNLKAHVSNSVTTDPEVSNPEWALREGMISFAGYPLTLEDKALGVVAFFARHPLSADVVDELKPIADGIAQWIKRKQAELALRDQQELLDVTLRSIGDAVVATDTAGKVTFLNPVAETLTGWRLDEAIGQPLEIVFNIVNESTRQPVENPVSKALREKRIVGLANHTVLITRDGHETAIDDSASPIRNDQGEIIGVILVFHEITARRKAEREREEALRQAEDAKREAEILNRVGLSLASELELSKVVQLAVDAGRELSGAEFGAFFYNATDEEESNFAHCALSGVGPEAFAKLGLTRTTPLLSSTFSGAGMLRVNDMATEGHHAKILELKDGSKPTAFYSFLAASVVSRSGIVLGGLFFGHSEPFKFSEMSARLVEGISGQASSALDNSHLYGALSKAKAELMAQANALEERVSERTARLEETIKSLEGVSYSIAHDLRGPLRSMEAFSTALLEDCSNEISATAHDYAKRIVAAARRMDALIKELLTYGQLAHQEIPVTRISVDEVVTSAVASLESTIREGRAQVSVAPLGTVRANATILEQAVINLLTNALKFVSKGEVPRIEIRAERRHDKLRLIVQDSGIGIAPQHQGRIFRIFERLDPKSYQGTGIGLAVVQKSVERMGGRVGVDSMPQKGSAFWIELEAA